MTSRHVILRQEIFCHSFTRVLHFRVEPSEIPSTASFAPLRHPDVSEVVKRKFKAYKKKHGALAFKRYKPTRGRKRKSTAAVVAVKRAKKAIKANNRPYLWGPVAFGLNQPTRVRMRHVNVIDGSFTVSNVLYAVAVRNLYINRLRDPDATAQDQAYPENYVDMCKLYRRYFVHGCKITVYLSGSTDVEQDAMIMFVRYGGGSPSIMNTINQNNILQEKGIRKHWFGPGTTQERTKQWKVGWFSCQRAARDQFYYKRPEEYAGTANSDGSQLADPTLSVPLYFQAFPAAPGVWANNVTYEIRIKMDFLVDWSDRRSDFEDSRTET